ncbi:ParB-like protein [Cupriavidus nantongensis]|uniref:ParB-like protein n=1 Tax=Cupriavidus nantongensis TaxID=1796606 RepID=UPI0009EDA404|nr:ParB/Srx family N-terminal domain-containing protein [Cupriavidus nantongensis]
MSNTTERPAGPTEPVPGAEPVLIPAASPRSPRGKAVAELARLRPTQLTLGYIHVHHKMEVTQRHADPEDREALQRFMRRHRIKTVAGPGGELYIVDHHHWARAWLDLGYQLAPVRVLEDFSDLDAAAFWKRMRQLGHVHPYDEHGKRQGPKALPSTVRSMRDDPYRSLAAFAREAGAYRKPDSAYGDFCWAGFLRKRVEQDLHSIAGFGLALAESIKLARSPRARRLPGFCGGPLEGKIGKPAKPLKTGKGKNGRAG